MRWLEPYLIILFLCLALVVASCGLWDICQTLFQ